MVSTREERVKCQEEQRWPRSLREEQERPGFSGDPVGTTFLPSSIFMCSHRTHTHIHTLPAFIHTQAWPCVQNHQRPELFSQGWDRPSDSVLAPIVDLVSVHGVPRSQYLAPGAHTPWSARDLRSCPPEGGAIRRGAVLATEHPMAPVRSSSSLLPAAGILLMQTEHVGVSL